MSDIIHRLHIVLVNPRGDGNIGAVARAMKNCGAANLVLVNPAPFDTPRGREMACSAQDVLKGARVVASLNEALGQSSFAVGFTARTGHHRRPIETFDDGIALIGQRLKRGPVALVFGREDDGLTNGELDRCDQVMGIPSSSIYPSFNLAQAVMIALHAVFRSVDSSSDPTLDDPFVVRADYRAMLASFERILARLGYSFDDGEALGSNIIVRFGHILGRAGVDRADVAMFEGLLARLDEATSSDSPVATKK